MTTWEFPSQEAAFSTGNKLPPLRGVRVHPVIDAHPLPNQQHATVAEYSPPCQPYSEEHGHSALCHHQPSTQHQHPHISSPYVPPPLASAAPADWVTPAAGKLNKDYLALSKEYAKFRAYRNLAGCQPCLLCLPAAVGAHSNASTHVFFPCGHKCVCSGCVAAHRITESGATTLGDGQDNWCFCPLCNEEIKMIAVPSPSVDVEQQYWAWVHAVKPVLPKGFAQGIKSMKNGLSRGVDNAQLTKPANHRAALAAASGMGIKTKTKKAKKKGKREACVLS